MTVVRSLGTYGSVMLNVLTFSGTADSAQDFVPLSGQLLFGPGETSRDLIMEILDDEIPEGPEDFYISITEVALIDSRSFEAFMLRRVHFTLMFSLTTQNVAHTVI